jgi:cell division inhibitor SepF
MTANLLKKTLVLFGLADDEEESEFYEEPEEIAFAEPANTPAPAPSVRRIDRSPDVARAERVGQLRSVTAPQVRVHVIEPTNYADAQKIADKFKANIPVIVNMQQQDADLAKRLIDFCSGLSYGLDGGMQAVGERVFLLTPSNVDVSAEERRRLAERGFLRT